LEEENEEGETQETIMKEMTDVNQAEEVAAAKYMHRKNAMILNISASVFLLVVLLTTYIVMR